MYVLSKSKHLSQLSQKRFAFWTKLLLSLRFSRLPNGTHRLYIRSCFTEKNGIHTTIPRFVQSIQLLIIQLILNRKFLSLYFVFDSFVLVSVLIMERKRSPNVRKILWCLWRENGWGRLKRIICTQSMVMDLGNSRNLMVNFFREQSLNWMIRELNRWTNLDCRVVPSFLCKSSSLM